MRRELKNIERAERYVNNELSADDKKLFAQELSEDASMRELTEHLENLKAAATRQALRKTIENHASGKGGFGKGAIISGILIILALASAVLFMNPFNEKESGETVHENPVITDTLELIEQIDESPVDQSFYGLKTWVKPDVQSFEFKASDGATIEGEEGMLIIVPSNAFADSNGALVKGSVELQLVEAFNVEQMVLYRLKTVSNGSLLESGGMFHLAAFANGEAIQINPKRPLYIEIPTTEHKEGMMAFRGEVDNQGDINWVDPVPLKKYLVNVPFEQLDFLPPGFEEVVKSKIPFQNYTEPSRALCDSLYYSLETWEYSSSENEIMGSIPEPISPIMEDTFAAYRLTDSVATTLSAATSNEAICGIRPSTVESMRTEQFQKTFIATREFEERIALLHEEDNGNALVEIYLNNITKDLWYSDSLVAKELNGRMSETFKAMAKERLTNTKDAPLYQDRLSNYYTDKLAEVRSYRKSLSNALEEKNQKELQEIYAGLTSSSRQNNDASRNLPIPPSSNAATSPVYSMQWSAMGWANIDQYYKMLSDGSKSVTIQVGDAPSKTEVSQWLGAVNTYADLYKSSKGYRAEFPIRSQNASTHVFAIAETDDGYAWGMKRYNPATVNTVNLEMTMATIHEIRNDLRGVDLTIGRIMKRQEERKERLRQNLEYELRWKQRRQKWLLEQKEISKKLNEALAKQRAINAIMRDLQQAAFPCDLASSMGSAKQADPYFNIFDPEKIDVKELNKGLE